jgi:hypothetical protein
MAPYTRTGLPISPLPRIVTTSCGCMTHACLAAHCWERGVQYPASAEEGAERSQGEDDTEQRRARPHVEQRLTIEGSESKRPQPRLGYRRRHEGRARRQSTTSDLVR